jgi:uncharacterized protein (DUF433 family)
MSKEYVTQVHGASRISDTRVSLDSVVCAFLQGLSPESIVNSFPILTLEQVYGAITSYLAHQVEVDAYLRQGEADFAALSQRLRDHNLSLRQTLAEGSSNMPRRTSQSRRSHESSLSG